MIVGKGERGKQRTKRKIEVEDMEEEGKRKTEHRNKNEEICRSGREGGCLKREGRRRSPKNRVGC